MAFWRTLTVVAAVQSSALPAAYLIRLSRPLQPEEAATVLAASRVAVAGKTFTFNYVGRVDGMQVLMRDDSIAMDELDLIGDAEFFGTEFRMLGEQRAILPS